MPVTTFAMLEAVIRELESIFLIFLSDYSHVANRRQIHGTNKGNAGGCKKKRCYAPLFQFLYLPLHPNRDMAKYLLKKTNYKSG